MSARPAIFRLNAGLWAAHSIDSSLDNDGWIGAARAVYSPLMGGNQLHFGVNYQHREFQSNNAGDDRRPSAGAPSTNQLARYRARPFSQLTDVRFVDTGNYAAKSDDIIGLEAAGHLQVAAHRGRRPVSEVQRLWRRRHAARHRPARRHHRPVPAATPTIACLVPDGNPSFWGGYIEAGYFLTGETRGYKNGTWDRTKVLKPFSKGGRGAFQINGRVDYLDLDSSKLHRRLHQQLR